MSITRSLANLGWKISRYSLIGEEIPREPGIIVGAPHTSNWDFIAFLGVMWSNQMKLKILVKKSMFVGPLAPILRALGAISIDRESPGDTVTQLVTKAKSGEPFQLVIAAKGTRSPQPYWKSGFYRIALAADLPVTIVSIDSNRREVEVGPTRKMTGNAKADMDLIRAFYADKAGVRPERRSEPRLREENRHE